MEKSEMEKILLEDVDDGFVLVGIEQEPSLSPQPGDADQFPEETDEEEAHFTSFCEDIVLSPRFPRNRKAIRMSIPMKEEAIKNLIKQQVLPFLPAKSACRFRSVSKDWNSWISGFFFAHQQSISFNTISGLFTQFPGETPSFLSLDRHSYGVPTPSLSFLPELVQVRATNGGLLCCQSQVMGSYYICNPVRQLWTRLPEPKLYHGPKTVVGLTFEPSHNGFNEHYQLVCAVISSTLVDDYHPPVVLFEIYSSRSNEWRECENLSCFDLGSPEFLGDGLYLEGFVYWQTGDGKVLAFDVKNEVFGFLTLPPNWGPDGCLSVMNGEVCYLLPVVDGVECTVEVYGNLDMSLKRVIRLTESYSFSLSGKCRALAFAKYDLLIVAFGTKIVAYDAEAQKEKWIGNATDDGRFEKYVPYVNKLVNMPPEGEGEFGVF